jgi:HK97 gp10 family phage protein
MPQPVFKFELHGLKECMAALDELPTMSMKKNVVRNALKKAALPVKKAAELKVQTLNLEEKEKLEKSIKIGTSLKRSQRGRQDRSRVTVYVGSSSRLAHLFEFGTAERFTTGKLSKKQIKAGKPPGKAGLYRGFIPAMPFLRPAWDAGKSVSLSILKDELWKALQKSARLLARKAAKGTLTKGQRAGLLR